VRKLRACSGDAHGPSAPENVAVSRIRVALDAAKGNRTIAAKTLGVHRTTIYSLMKRLGV